jgi:hypothetical protein
MNGRSTSNLFMVGFPLLSDDEDSVNGTTGAWARDRAFEIRAANPFLAFFGGFVDNRADRPFAYALVAEPEAVGTRELRAYKDIFGGIRNARVVYRWVGRLRSRTAFE